jgi:hypothetical protein
VRSSRGLFPGRLAIEKLASPGTVQGDRRQLHEKGMPRVALMGAQGGEVPYRVLPQRKEQAGQAEGPGLPISHQPGSDQGFIEQVVDAGSRAISGNGLLILEAFSPRRL